MDYWVFKMDRWPDLAQNALEVLSCPSASVLSKRVYSASGGDGSKPTDASTCRDNVDHLTFIKMNLAWILDELHNPMVNSTNRLLQTTDHRFINITSTHSALELMVVMLLSLLHPHYSLQFICMHYVY